MSENEIRQVLNVLLQDREQLKAELEDLESVIKRFERRLPGFVEQKPFNDVVITSSIRPHSSESNDLFAKAPEPNSSDANNVYPDFPSNESVEDQIIYLLNSIGRITRLPILQEEYNKASGSEDKNIQSVVRRMRDSQTLLAAKFNNAWTSVFYGLPEWVETDENGNKTFKESFRPTRKELPTGYNTINFDF